MSTPPENELQAAGTEMRLARLRAELEAELSRTLYGRVSWRLACWYARTRGRV